MTIYEDIFWTALLIFMLPVAIVVYVVLMIVGFMWNLIIGRNVFKKDESKYLN